MPTQPARKGFLRTGRPSFLRQVLIVVAVVVAAFGLITVLWFRLLDFIPTVGPLMSAIPAMLLAPPDRSVARPLCGSPVPFRELRHRESSDASHSPALRRPAAAGAVAIIALVIMGKLFGFIGLLLAVPAVVTALIVTRMFYIETVPGDPPKANSIGE